MSRSVFSYSIVERLKVGRVLRPITEKYGPLQERASRDALQEAVSLMEVATASEPREWIYWYILGDWYSALGDYAKAVRACERCYELRPRDPRSAYALATTLRVLTRAKYVGHPRVAEMREFYARSGISRYDDFNPLKSQQALEELGLTIDQAAERALRLFEQVITLGVKASEAKMIRGTLAAMYAEFPHLRGKVRFGRRKQAGREGSPRGTLKWLKIGLVTGIGFGFLDLLLLMGIAVLGFILSAGSTAADIKDVPSTTYSLLGCCGAMVRWFVVSAGAGVVAAYSLLRGDVHLASSPGTKSAGSGAVAGLVTILIDTVGVVLASILMPSAPNPLLYLITLCIWQGIGLLLGTGLGSAAAAIYCRARLKAQG